MTQVSMLGYRDPAYADALSGHGLPRRLPCSGGWMLERAIPGCLLHDGMGVYPLLSCADWFLLPEDLRIIRGEGLVSLVAVSDPFLEAGGSDPFLGFDLVRPFKTHFAAHLDRPLSQIVSRHHAACARRAARGLEVHLAEEPLDHLDVWCALYSQLIARHQITDLRRFSRESFRLQLQIPGAHLFLAMKSGRPVGAQLVLQQGDVAHAHLSAFSPEGYASGASYLLDWWALDHFHGKVRVLNWGGGAHGDLEDGLARYKQGWSTDRHTSFLLGAILDPERYGVLSSASGTPDTAYFPAYRCGEFSESP